jgi:hypothetical protein
VELFGLFLLLAGFRATLNGLHESINSYDEGIILSGANLLLMGKQPYSDFYSNYPPGIFLVVAGIWKILGTSVHAERVLGFAVHAALAIASGLLAGKMSGHWFSFLSAGLASLWLSFLTLVPYAWFASQIGSPGPPAYPELSRANDIADSQAASRRQVLAFVQQSTRPGEAIFVGATQHQQVHANEMDLYFLADRPGARRYMQFDPNVINREDVQKEMIAQLETKQVRLVILSRRYMSNSENNESQKRGSDLLDRYLNAEFRVGLEIGPYRVLTR